MPADSPVTLYKRWRLRPGTSVDEVVDLVEVAIVPRYRALSDEVRLGMEVWDEETVVAVQRWTGRGALLAATTGARFASWWQDYLPVLARWDALVELDDEWEAEVRVG